MAHGDMNLDGMQSQDAIAQNACFFILLRRERSGYQCIMRGQQHE